MERNRNHIYIKYVLLAILLYMPVFGHLDGLTIRKYDEARLALNASEMLGNGNYLVTIYHGKPDMWNTKPPFAIWGQVFFMKMIGVNEISVRLPSAIAALLTFLVLLIFAIRYLKSFWFGFISILVLVTSQGYIAIHATRTGDYDAPLTFFTTLSGLLFFSFIETKKSRHLYLFFLTLALAVLTKSITGLLFLPALAIYGLWQKQFLNIIRNKHFYFGLLGFLILVIGYYLTRESLNPGYLRAVQENELGGRFMNVIENHEHGFWYYLNNIVQTNLNAWYLLIPCGLLIGLYHKDSKINHLTKFSFLMVITFFLIISSAQTKLFWYDVPIYPFLALLIAPFIYLIFEFLKNANWINGALKRNILPFLFLFLLFFGPYRDIINKTYLPKEDDMKAQEITYYLKDTMKGKHDTNGYYLVTEGYNPHCEFYLKMLQIRGTEIGFRDPGKLNVGDKIIVYQDNVSKYIQENYTQKMLEQTGNVLKYEIYERKEQ